MQNNIESTKISPEDSIQIIYEMIRSTRTQIGKNYFYYLFWGYLVVLTCITEYVLILVGYPRHYMVWPVFMGTGTLVSLVFYFAHQQENGTRTFAGSAMAFLWGAWFITLVLLITYMVCAHQYNLILPVTMAMYGLAIFVSGGIVGFTALNFAAIIAWCASLVSFFVVYKTQLIFMIVLVIVAYIVPGHILKNKSNNQRNV
jgi:hypothetical protein